jgi:Asp-tRNA(Asn)/Glu-tRNA(Gln) amidotransferase A subunit family amidase
MDLATDDITWKPAWEIRELIGAREISPVEVVDHFLARVTELNPTLSAFVNVDYAGAREQSKAAEAAVIAGAPLGALHGIPIAVKDSVKVRGLPSCMFGTPSAREDAIGIARLRDAGAIFIGTTALVGPEEMDLIAVLQFDTQRAAKTQSLTHTLLGRPANPWDLSKDPGPSSRGSAAAAAARLVPIAIGTDGAGSCRLPAALSGVVGVHSTRGLIPFVDYELPTLWLTLTMGPLARDVRDCAIVTSLMAGPDGRDVVCLQDDPPDYLAAIDIGAAGLRLAWTDDYGYAYQYAVRETPQVIDVARRAAMNLRSLGATVEVTDVVWEDPGLVYDTIIGAFHPFASAGIPQRASDPPTADALQAACEQRARNWGRFRHLFRDYDLLLSVTCPMVAPPVDKFALPWSSEIQQQYLCHTQMFNLLGLPATSVPCGFVEGMPVGLQIVGPPGREDLIFRLANAFQRAFRFADRPPVDGDRRASTT